MTKAAQAQTEQALRVQLAACYRIFDMLGWTEMISNPITLRIPGPEQHFLINPFGLYFNEVTASNLVKIDINGNILQDSEYPINPAGFTLHSAIHKQIPDAHCIMHTHTTAGCAVACADSGLSPDNFYSAQLYDRVAYHDFEGITLHAEEAPRLGQSIGNKPAVILRNHGLLSWGITLPMAFATLWTLQRACEIQVMGAALGPTRVISRQIQQKCSAEALQFDPRHGAGDDIFTALIRQIDRRDPSYKN